MGEDFEHSPVMLTEVVDLIAPVPAGVVVDMTVGGGGHAGAILRSRDDLRLLGIDRDPAAVAAAGAALEYFGNRARVLNGGFEHVADIVGSTTEEQIVAILFDLGVSSPQLDRSARGFSYWADDAPLDMRMDTAQVLTAATVVNTYAEGDLARLVRANGEDRHARRIAHEIVRARPLATTGDLVAAVKRAIPAPARRRGGHPARRTFQAVRMEVNRELPNLAEGLDESVHLLATNGRMLVLAYHSLEDRMVKERFADWSRTEEPGGPRELPARTRIPLVRQLTRRPLRPKLAETDANPRASSARLRAVEKVAR